MANVQSVDDRVAEWRRRYEHGEFPTAVELCSDCPELVTEVERRIDELESSPAFLTQGAEDNAADATLDEATQPDATPSDTLTFNHRFNKLRFHKKGGLGEVYIADDLELQRDVVLKFIRKRHHSRKEIQDQFQLEAQITAKLDHPGVVPVYGIGRHPDGRACYAMRYIQGVTLDETIAQFHAPRVARPDGRESRDTSPFSAARTGELHGLLTHFLTSCKTIAYAHNRGIVHRDIKPDNIMLGKYGETLVVDWGLAMPVNRDVLARASGEETLLPGSGSGSSSSGSTGGPVGTPAFMSPEQANGAVVRPASDIFSLGATLFKLLTGHAPYSGESAHEVVAKARYASFQPLRRLDKRVPRPLAAVCEKAMSIDPAKRYITAMELAKDLECWLAGDPVTAYRESFSERVGRWTRLHRVWTQAILTALVVVTLVVTVAAMLLSQSANSEHVARTAAEATRQDSLQLAAEFVAKAVGQDLQTRWLVLEREAADPELIQRVRKFDSEPVNPSMDDLHLQLWLSDHAEQLKSSAPARSWSVFDQLGICRGRHPRSETIGKNFAYRDYFHGQGRDFDDNNPGPFPALKKPHRSNVFRSQNEDQAWVTVLSVPIWSGTAGERQVLGVLTMSLQIGQFAVLDSRLGDGNRVLRLIDTNASASVDGKEGEKGTVLFDSRSRNGTLSKTPQRISQPLVKELEELRVRRLVQQQQKLATTEFFKDRFTDDDAPSGTEWVAAFEPVILRTASGELHDTGWVVVVQQPAEAHDKR